MFAPTPSGRGYWLVTDFGAVYSFGDARNYGDATRLNLPGAIIGIAPTGDGNGYYLLGSTGAVYRYGDAGASAAPPPSGSLASVITLR